jgi:hypothetical protein
VGPELVARQEGVLREALKDAVAAAVRAVAVSVGRRVVDPEAMVPRGPSARAAPNEPRLVFSAARSSRRGGGRLGKGPAPSVHASFPLHGLSGSGG